ncbi:MAG: hypothetical protein WCA81_05105 [Rhizomicrobium sp.]|jgi:hypothetical protein
MQISAANILIASQQAAKAAPPRPEAGVFAAALANEKKTAFEPLSFKQAAQPPAQAAPASTPSMSATFTPLGLQVDIRV